jgi:hypothetical protein
MNKLAVSATYYSSNYSLKRPDLVWAAIKENVGKHLKKYNDWVKEMKKITPDFAYKTLAVSMESTALRILWIYVQKFKLGQIRNYTVKFCRSYLAGSVGASFTAPHVMTMDRHLERLLQMPNSFIKEKSRSTLNLPDRDTNCIAVQIDPSLLVFTDPKHQENHIKGIEIMNQPKPRNQKKSYKINTQPMIAPPMPIRMPQTQEMKAEVRNAKTSASSLGNLMGSFLSNFPDNPNIS